MDVTTSDAVVNNVLARNSASVQGAQGANNKVISGIVLEEVQSAIEVLDKEETEGHKIDVWLNNVHDRSGHAHEDAQIRVPHALAITND